MSAHYELLAQRLGRGLIGVLLGVAPISGQETSPTVPPAGPVDTSDHRLALVTVGGESDQPERDGYDLSSRVAHTQPDAGVADADYRARDCKNRRADWSSGRSGSAPFHISISRVYWALAVAVSPIASAACAMPAIALGRPGVRRSVSSKCLRASAGLPMSISIDP